MKLAKRLTVFLLCASMITLVHSGCKSWSKTAKGGTIGAAGGALAGAVIGKVAGNTTTGAIIGAAVGGAAGAAIGNYMDRQAEEIEENVDDAEVERIGEGIKVTLDSGILFDVNSSNLRAASKSSIRELAGVMKDYEDTEIVFAGHTDSDGSDELNQQLSEDRAKAVALYAAQQGIDAERMVINGYGENDPIADNSTETGKQENRRVEIAIYANEELKERAEDGDIGQNN
jgi:outer membrane protein OmpA-like peptidoglycan-associated protein